MRNSTSTSRFCHTRCMKLGEERVNSPSGLQPGVFLGRWTVCFPYCLHQRNRLRQFVNCVTACKGLESAGLHFPADSNDTNALASASLLQAGPKVYSHPLIILPYPRGRRGEGSPSSLVSSLATQAYPAFPVALWPLLLLCHPGWTSGHPWCIGIAWC